jgi:sorting nexin-8
LEAAHQLGKLCENRCLIVNLIPYNATDVKDKLQCPSEGQMQAFRDIVASYGSMCTIRRTMGADIASACGQLVQKTEAKETATPVAVDIEDVVADKSANKKTREASKASTTSKASDIKGKSRDVVTKDNSSSTKPRKLGSWLESLSTEDLEKWGRAFTIGSAVVASCFIASSLVLVRKKR